MNTKVNEKSDYLKTVHAYYTNYFPYELLHEWFSYGDPEFFTRREFAFTKRNNIWIRYRSFQDCEALRATILSQRPDKINIGAVYNKPPESSRSDDDFKPVARELVFDLDLSDYNDVRTCCNETKICRKCWKFVKIALKILHKILQDYCGFKHVLWVFSGRRGIHAWVCDEDIRVVPKNVRQSIIESLNIFNGKTGRRVILDEKPYHPIIAMSLDVIAPEFIPLCVEEQNMLGDADTVEKILKFVPVEIRDYLRTTLVDILPTSVVRWNFFENYIKHHVITNAQWTEYHNCLDEIMLQWCFPRLDADVTTGMKHLLKSPFSVHADTGKISIPLNPLLFDKFDPLTAPCIYSLENEAREYDTKLKRKNIYFNTKGWNKTSLRHSINIFNNFLYNMDMERRASTVK